MAFMEDALLVVTAIGSFDICTRIVPPGVDELCFFHNSTNNYIRQSNGNRRMGG
jgi:hypothetical protein